MPQVYEPPGTNFTRLAIAKVLGAKTGDSVDVAARRWGADSVPARILRAAVSGADSDSGNWGHELSDARNAMTEFMDLVRPMTVIGQLQGLRMVAANAPYVRTEIGSTAHWIGQSKAIKVSAMALARDVMAPLKLATLSVFSNELLENSAPEAEALIRRDLVAGVAQLADTTFLDSSNAGSAGNYPASVTNGASSVAGSGSFNADVADALEAFAGDYRRASWVCSPRLALQIGGVLGSGDPRNSVGLLGGVLRGLPLIVSTASEHSSSGGELVLIDAGGVVMCDLGATVRASGDAMLELDDDPQGATDTPVATSVNRVSMYQADCAAIICTRRINWAANPGAVVVVTAADYAAS